MLDNPERKTFVSTYDGEFTIECQQSDEHAQHRVKESGKGVWYKAFKRLTGNIIDIKITTNEYEGKTFKSLVLDIKSDNVYSLQLPYLGDMARAFFNTMMNIDFEKPVVLKPKRIEGKDNLFIQQDGIYLRYFYTKDDPKGRPNWEKIEYNGQTKWDRTKELDFFMRVINEKIKPRIEQAINYKSATEPTSKSNTDKENEDDLPF